MTNHWTYKLSSFLSYKIYKIVSNTIQYYHTNWNIFCTYHILQVVWRYTFFQQQSLFVWAFLHVLMTIIIMISSSDAVQWYDKCYEVHYERHFSILKCTIYEDAASFFFGQECFLCVLLRGWWWRWWWQCSTLRHTPAQYFTSYVCAVLRRRIVLLKVEKSLKS